MAAFWCLKAAVSALRPHFGSARTAVKTSFAWTRPASSQGTAQVSPVQTATQEHAKDKTNCFFTRDHMWVRIGSDDGMATIGITKHAATTLGDVVFVDTVPDGTKLHAGDEIGAVESTKAATELYAPISGRVFLANRELKKNPALVNRFPMDRGWIYKIAHEDYSETSSLLNEQAYQAYVDGKSDKE